MMESEVDVLAGGLVELFQPVVREYQDKVVKIHEGQQQLGAQIDRLVAELEGLVHNTEFPKLKTHMQKLGNTRKRISSLNSTLTVIMARLQHIESQLGVHRDAIDPKEKESRLDVGGGEPTESGVYVRAVIERNAI